jgi:hypothetical protein
MRTSEPPHWRVPVRNGAPQNSALPPLYTTGGRERQLTIINLKRQTQAIEKISGNLI